jgi:hypothetical protein
MPPIIVHRTERCPFAAGACGRTARRCRAVAADLADDRVHLPVAGPEDGIDAFYLDIAVKPPKE